MGNPKQNIRRGKVIAQHYSMVKISHADLGYTRSHLVKDRDKVAEEG
jgi:hypothetical protein